MRRASHPIPRLLDRLRHLENRAFHQSISLHPKSAMFETLAVAGLRSRRSRCREDALRRRNFPALSTSRRPRRHCAEKLDFPGSGTTGPRKRRNRLHTGPTAKHGHRRRRDGPRQRHSHGRRRPAVAQPQVPPRLPRPSPSIRRRPLYCPAPPRRRLLRHGCPPPTGHASTPHPRPHLRLPRLR